MGRESPTCKYMKCNSWLIEKDPDAGKDWGQEKVATEDEMFGWHHWLNEHEFEQTLRDSEGRGAWRDAVHGVTRSRTWLSNRTIAASWQWGVCIYPERKGNLRSHETLLLAQEPDFFLYGSFLVRRRQWHPTPVLLPGKSHGQRSLVGCSPWGR